METSLWQDILNTDPVLGGANEWDLLNADVVGLKGSLWRGCNSCIMMLVIKGNTEFEFN